LSIRGVRKNITEATRGYLEAKVTQPRAEIKFGTELPITIFAIGDVHYGSIYTDTDKFHQDMEEIIATPNAYIVLMSNLIDNAIPAKYPDGMLANAIPPNQQVIAMRKIIQELDEAGKILGAVESPCHEGWTYQVAGQDINKLIFGYEGRQFPILENGGHLDLRFTDGRRTKQKYRMVLYHQVGPFESNFNEVHALKQMNRLNENMQADIIIGAHKHWGATHMSYEGKERKIVAYIRSGTYKGIGKVPDAWIQQRRGVSGEPSGESVTIYPRKRILDTHLDFETGLLAHEAHYLLAALRNDRKKT